MTIHYTSEVDDQALSSRSGTPSERRSGVRSGQVRTSKVPFKAETSWPASGHNRSWKRQSSNSPGDSVSKLFEGAAVSKNLKNN